jgi:hypothetical protein
MFSALSLRVPGEHWRFIQGDPSATDWARNDLVYQFLDNDDAKWLLQVDRDAILHPETVTRLLSWDKRVVSALAFTRGIPPLPNVWTKPHSQIPGRYISDFAGTVDWLKEHDIRTNGPYLVDPRPGDALVEVKRTGAHCLMVHRSVYEEMGPPWFKYHEQRDVGNRGEDFFFCQRLIEMGVPIYVDRSVVAGHCAGDRSIGPTDFMAYTSIVRNMEA